MIIDCLIGMAVIRRNGFNNNHAGAIVVSCSRFDSSETLMRNKFVFAFITLACAISACGAPRTLQQAVPSQERMAVSSNALSVHIPPHQSLDHKLIVGYQGWFGCPGDFENNTRWQHWFLNTDRADELMVDQLPSLREFSPRDLCPTSMKRADGSPIFLFSSQNPRVVATHFQWMKKHGVDGVAAQRFISELNDAASKRRRDNVLRNIRAAAEATGRFFYVTYDVSGANPATVTDAVRADWRHLNDTLKITASPNYLYDSGKPVLQLWGFGFEGRPGDANQVLSLISDLKAGQNSLRAATMIGGVPTNWRTLDGDAKRGAQWRDVYAAYDVLSPWTVGRYGEENGDDNGVDRFARDRVTPDLAMLRNTRQRYMPVIFPGFSWVNLMKQRGKIGSEKNAAKLNQISRRCGNFLWKQASSMMDAGATTLYAAMFDEVDEATALFPTEPKPDALPKDTAMIFLNNDGCALPDDWYLNIAGKVGAHLNEKRALPRSLNSVMTP
jgi:hypothetical protein